MSKIKKVAMFLAYITQFLGSAILKKKILKNQFQLLKISKNLLAPFTKNIQISQ